MEVIRIESQDDFYFKVDDAINFKRQPAMRGKDNSEVIKM
jgi:hypothetical protein